MKTLSRITIVSTLLASTGWVVAQASFLPGPDMSALDPSSRYQPASVSGTGEQPASAVCQSVQRGDSTVIRTVGGEAVSGPGVNHPGR